MTARLKSPQHVEFERREKRARWQLVRGQAERSVARLRNIDREITDEEVIRGARWQLVREQARKILARLQVCEWDESLHPRDPDGKFGSGGGGGSGDTKPSPKEQSKEAKGEKNAADMLQPDNKTVDDVIDGVPKGREYIGWAKDQLKSSKPTDNLVADGGFVVKRGEKGRPHEYTPERAAEHDKILDEIFTDEEMLKATPNEGEKPVIYMLGGRGGSGKSFFTKGDKAPVDVSTAIVLNNDDIKDKLPGYAGWNAGMFHEESSQVGDRAEAFALDKKLNVVIDGTMKTEKSLLARIEKFKAAGYEVRGYYMYTSPAKSAERALKRAIDGQEEDGKGRFVPPEYSMGSKTNEASFDAAKPHMDHWEIYDNNVDGRKPVFYSRKGG